MPHSFPHVVVIRCSISGYRYGYVVPICRYRLRLLPVHTRFTIYAVLPTIFVTLFRYYTCPPPFTTHHRYVTPRDSHDLPYALLRHVLLPAYVTFSVFDLHSLLILVVCCSFSFVTLPLVTLRSTFVHVCSSTDLRSAFNLRYLDRCSVFTFHSRYVTVC